MLIEIYVLHVYVSKCDFTLYDILCMNHHLNVVIESSEIKN